MILKDLQAELATQAPGLEGMFKQVELVGRVCYHSEDKINDKSYLKFIEHQCRQQHMSPLEAGTVYLAFDICSEENKRFQQFFKENPFSFSKQVHNLVYVTTNYRVIVENDLHDFMVKHWSEPTEWHVLRHCIKMQCNIAAYKDFTRHRAASPMVESTRFCNYFNGKFGTAVSFIDPLQVGVKPEDKEEWCNDLKTLEKIYLKWASRYPAQTASQFLCQETAATIFLTAFTPDWQHFCDLRYHETTGPVRPECKALAEKSFHLLKGYGLV